MRDTSVFATAVGQHGTRSCGTPPSLYGKTTAYGYAKVESRVRIPGALLRAAVPRNLIGGWGLLLAAPSRPNLRFVPKRTNLRNREGEQH